MALTLLEDSMHQLLNTHCDHKSRGSHHTLVWQLIT